MAQQLGSVAVGSIVKINENGSPVNYIVVHQGRPSQMYDASCDGTWLLRQACIKEDGWASNFNLIDQSYIQEYFNSNMLALYDSEIQGKIKTVKIPYCPGYNSSSVNSGANGLSCKVFPLGAIEVGLLTNPSIPNDGAKLDYFIEGTDSSANDKRTATLEQSGAVTDWWLRTPYARNREDVCFIQHYGALSWQAPDISAGYRPTIILPTNLFVLDDGSISAKPPAPGNISTPLMVMEGKQIAISFDPVSIATSYILQRKTNANSSWTQIYSGGNTSFSDTAGSWTSVQYRVCAVSSGVSSDYTTSASVEIVPKSALVISGTDGDLGILTNDVQYSISSNQTSPTIDATVEVNGGEYAAFQATSGQTYTVSVLDLPTGTGSIVITATTEVSSSPVTVTRTWTYTKTAPTFPETGSVADLTQQGNTIWPKTIAEAVRTPGIWGGNLGLALSKLANAVLYDPKTGGFNGIGGADATIPMVSIETGSYVGTGTYGSGNPNSLTFNGSPKIVFLKQPPPSGSNPGKADVFLIYPGTSFVFDGNGSMLKITVQWEQNKVKWYSNAANTQFNENGETYVYAAITIPGGAT